MGFFGTLKRALSSAPSTPPIPLTDQELKRLALTVFRDTSPSPSFKELQQAVKSLAPVLKKQSTDVVKEMVKDFLTTPGAKKCTTPNCAINALVLYGTKHYGPLPGTNVILMHNEFKRDFDEEDMYFLYLNNLYKLMNCIDRDYSYISALMLNNPPMNIMKAMHKIQHEADLYTAIDVAVTFEISLGEAFDYMEQLIDFECFTFKILPDAEVKVSTCGQRPQSPSKNARIEILNRLIDIYAEILVEEERVGQSRRPKNQKSPKRQKMNNKQRKSRK